MTALLAPAASHRQRGADDDEVGWARSQAPFNDVMVTRVEMAVAHEPWAARR